MTSVETDFDAFRDDFVLYLAKRLGVSEDAALGYLTHGPSTWAPFVATERAFRYWTAASSRRNRWGCRGPGATAERALTSSTTATVVFITSCQGILGSRTSFVFEKSAWGHVLSTPD
jgi:hypothetical protein